MSKENRGPRARRARRGEPSVDLHVHRSRHAHLLFEELCASLREASDPALADVRFLCLTLSPDGGHATLAYAVEASGFCEEAPLRRRTQEALGRAGAYLRSQLVARLHLHAVPTLSFAFAGVVMPATKGGDDPCRL